MLLLREHVVHGVNVFLAHLRRRPVLILIWHRDVLSSSFLSGKLFQWGNELLYLGFVRHGISHWRDKTIHCCRAVHVLRLGAVWHLSNYTLGHVAEIRVRLRVPT